MQAQEVPVIAVLAVELMMGLEGLLTEVREVHVMQDLVGLSIQVRAAPLIEALEALHREPQVVRRMMVPVVQLIEAQEGLAIRGLAALATQAREVWLPDVLQFAAASIYARAIGASLMLVV